MARSGRRAHDLRLLDALNASKREALDIDVWRMVRSGRDPAQGSPSQSRWCNGSFNALYTSLERDGAIAEIYALLALQPVFPSKDQWHAYKLQVSADRILRFDRLAMLAVLGVDQERYQDRQYRRTQEIADAAVFIGCGGLIVPSARWDCSNLVLFTDNIPSDAIRVVEIGSQVDWELWRKHVGR